MLPLAVGTGVTAYDFTLFPAVLSVENQQTVIVRYRLLIAYKLSVRLMLSSRYGFSVASDR